MVNPVTMVQAQLTSGQVVIEAESDAKKFGHKIIGGVFDEAKVTKSSVTPSSNASADVNPEAMDSPESKPAQIGSVQPAKVAAHTSIPARVRQEYAAGVQTGQNFGTTVPTAVKPVPKAIVPKTNGVTHTESAPATQAISAPFALKVTTDLDRQQEAAEANYIRLNKTAWLEKEANKSEHFYYLSEEDRQWLQNVAPDRQSRQRLCDNFGRLTSKRIQEETAERQRLLAQNDPKNAGRIADLNNDIGRLDHNLKHLAEDLNNSREGQWHADPYEQDYSTLLMYAVNGAYGPIDNSPKALRYRHEREDCLRYALQNCTNETEMRKVLKGSKLSPSETDDLIKMALKLSPESVMFNNYLNELGVNKNGRFLQIEDLPTGSYKSSDVHRVPQGLGYAQGKGERERADAFNKDLPNFKVGDIILQRGVHGQHYATVYAGVERFMNDFELDNNDSPHFMTVLRNAKGHPLDSSVISSSSYDGYIDMHGRIHKAK